MKDPFIQFVVMMFLFYTLGPYVFRFLGMA
jgi:hypothetical protein